MVLSWVVVYCVVGYGIGLSQINKDFMNNHIYPTGSVWIERENSGNILFKG